MKRRRRLVAIGAAVALVATLSGCAGQASKDSSEAKSDGTITFRSWSPIEQTNKMMIEATEKKIDGVKIESTIFNYPEYLVDLSTRASSHTMPDIIGLQPGALTQQYRSQLMPLNECAEKTWGKDWESKFHPIGLEQARLGNPEGDDNYYSLPLLVQTVNMWANSDILKEEGIEIPKTFDELKDAAQKMKGKPYAGFLLPAKDSWLRNVVFLQIAANVTPGKVYEAEQGKAKWTDPKIVEALGYWEKLFSEGIAQEGALGLDAYPNGANQFEGGKAAMIPLGAWWIQQSDPAKTDAPPLSQGMAGYEPFLFPTIPGGTDESQLVGGIDVSLGISKDTKDKDKACQVLTDWIGGEGAQVLINTFNDLPAFKGVNPKEFTSDKQKEIWDKMNNEWMPKVKYSRYLASPEMDTALGDQLAAIASGKTTPEDAAKALQAEQDKVLGTQ
ncbi:MAG: extracellular solute-binding protein [Actinomycetaceae bacterium]|nr:extracellular solute-binding protein [Actinomycetaceae bacterium]